MAKLYAQDDKLAIHSLHKKGYHLVLCNQSKISTQKAWQRKTPALNTVREHIKGGGLVGLIPASAGFEVLEVDTTAASNALDVRGGCHGASNPLI